jgi:hypothetical protein
MMEDDEDTLIFKDAKESELYQFVIYTIKDVVKKELEVPDKSDPSTIWDEHERTYGMCKVPFGIVRIRIVEYLAQVYQTFAKEVSQVFAEEGIFD